MSNLLKKKHALTSLRTKLEGSTGNARDLDTKPNIAGKRRKKKGNRLPKINLKY